MPRANTASRMGSSNPGAALHTKHVEQCKPPHRTQRLHCLRLLSQGCSFQRCSPLHKIGSTLHVALMSHVSCLHFGLSISPVTHRSTQDITASIIVYVFPISAFWGTQDCYIVFADWEGRTGTFHVGGPSGLLNEPLYNSCCAVGTERGRGYPGPAGVPPRLQLYLTAIPAPAGCWDTLASLE